jgi:hypothetical protein
MVIKEENDDEIEINMNRDRNDQYLRAPTAKHFSRSSIIGTHHGKSEILSQSIILLLPFIIYS